MKFILRILVALIITVVGMTSAFAQKMTPEEVIGKHLNSIGSESMRAGVKSMMAVGTGTQRFTSTADSPAEGRIVFASEQTKMFLGMQMNSTQYPGQQFKFDGKKYDVAITTQGGRDFLGVFVQDNPSLLKAGIFGGVLSTGWLVANHSEGNGKFSMAGTSKVNGREAYSVEYGPKGGSDITIKLLFDMETFQHVRTEYRRITSARQGVMVRRTLGGIDDNSAKQLETRLTVTEDFGDYKLASGLMLPHRYKINYSRFGNQGTIECLWDFTMSSFVVNPKLSPESFVVDPKEVSD